MINADGDSLNGTRVRLWKVELQKQAIEPGMKIAVCYLPPGRSRHRSNSFFTTLWRRKAAGLIEPSKSVTSAQQYRASADILAPRKLPSEFAELSFAKPCEIPGLRVGRPGQAGKFRKADAVPKREPLRFREPSSKRPGRSDPSS